MFNPSRSMSLSVLIQRSIPFILSIFVSWVIVVEARADQRIVRASTPTELVAAIGGLGDPVHGEGDNLLILLAAGDYPLNQLPDTNIALPEIPAGVALEIRPEDPDSQVTFLGGGPGSNYGLMRSHPSAVTGDTMVRVRE